MGSYKCNVHSLETGLGVLNFQLLMDSKMLCHSKAVAVSYTSQKSTGYQGEAFSTVNCAANL